MKLSESMEFTMTIENADLDIMAKVLKDIKIPECPYFDISDKYGNEARYYRENRWIPCSDRLPEEDGRYLVTLENGHEKILNYATTQTIRYPQGFYYITEDGFAWRQTQNLVTAWMPLPEPWKGGENDT